MMCLVSGVRASARNTTRAPGRTSSSWAVVTVRAAPGTGPAWRRTTVASTPKGARRRSSSSVMPPPPRMVTRAPCSEVPAGAPQLWARMRSGQQPQAGQGQQSGRARPPARRRSPWRRSTSGLDRSGRPPTMFSTPAKGSCTQRSPGWSSSTAASPSRSWAAQPDQGVGLFTELDRDPAPGPHGVLGEPASWSARWRRAGLPCQDPRDAAGRPRYIRSGASMPSTPSPRASTDAVSRAQHQPAVAHGRVAGLQHRARLEEGGEHPRQVEQVPAQPVRAPPLEGRGERRPRTRAGPAPGPAPPAASSRTGTAPDR